ncbi:hypothetical protein EN807_34475 [Mesorhizobium sp. M5C.F.Ca.ET.164.01.1.1]|nr:hypothetical protein EN807_34475 [Mesorhizobium sp. M5C.F.Ca.ET.164.01.1.1]
MTALVTEYLSYYNFGIPPPFHEIFLSSAGRYDQFLKGALFGKKIDRLFSFHHVKIFVRV